MKAQMKFLSAVSSCTLFITVVIGCGSSLVTPGQGADSTLGLLANQICLGFTVLGIQGASACALPSGAHRTPGNSDERDIPDLTIDDSGFDGIITLQSPDTGAITSCGTTQNTIEARIADCNYSWDGENKGYMGEGKWSLVTKVNGNEIWRDDRTGLIWSDIVGPTASWCEASGNRENAGGADCSANTVSVCAEALGLNSDGFDEGKGGMRKTGTATSPSVSWRLPTLRDYLQAYANGWGYVFPVQGPKGKSLRQIAWTATVLSSVPSSAHIFDAEDSDVYIMDAIRSNPAAAYVRCVGR